MPIDILPDQLITPTRDDIITRYERDWQLRVPGAKVGEGTEPGIKARIVADQLLPLYGEAARNAQIASVDDMDAGQLADEAELLGIPTTLPAVGASGAVIVTASSGGGTIFAGDQITNLQTGLRYQCTATAVYTDQQEVPIAGVDAGVNTNVDPGTQLTWTLQRPGIATVAIVATQSDGSGLTGGRDAETSDELRLRIKDAKANPAVAGNDAAYQTAAAATPNIAIQAAFTYPCVLGPGSTGLAFTLRPATPGASRIPNPTQIAAVRQYVVGQFPKDDGLLSISLVAQPVDMRLQVTWDPGAAGWTDSMPWPPYDFTNPVYVLGSPAPTATTFTLASADTGFVTPQPGQTLALYDAANGTFVRKKIGNTPTGVVGGGLVSWVIICDTTHGVSDTEFVPAANDRVCPWSDSLQALVAPIVAEFDAFGPGEEFASFFDAGLRQKRSPSSPTTYPSVISGRNVGSLYALPQLFDVELVEPSLPFSATIGAPGVTAYLFELKSIVVFPL